jgi:predicted PhzF superfamily epimerase YddE/YHI9
VKPGVRIHLRQGVEMGRPSDLYLAAGLKNEECGSAAAKVVDVRVAGSTVLVATGRLFLP